MINKHIKSGGPHPTPPTEGWFEHQANKYGSTAYAQSIVDAVKHHEYMHPNGCGHYGYLKTEEARGGNDLETEVEKLWDTTQAGLDTKANEKKAIIEAAIQAEARRQAEVVLKQLEYWIPTDGRWQPTTQWF